MRDLFADIAIYYGKRRSIKQRIRFINYLEKQIKPKNIKIKLIRKKERLNEMIHLVVGDLENSKKVVICPYDTGSKMLVPFYKYTPFDMKNNFVNEIINTTIYIIIGILLLLIMLFISRYFRENTFFIKILIVVSDIILAFSTVKMFLNLDNKMNFNRNSQSVTVMLKSLLENQNRVAYIFVDQAIMVNTGYKTIKDLLPNKEVLVLDTIGTNDKMYLACTSKYKKRAKEIIEILSNEIELLILDENQIENSIMKYFDKAFVLTSGKMNRKGLLEVHSVRTSKDNDVNMERMNKITSGLKHYS